MKPLLPPLGSLSPSRRGPPLVAAGFALGVAHARTQAGLTYSGGNGAPRTLELDAPVTLR